MSLFKQLWLSIFIIIVMCLAGSFLLTTFSAKNYLETQLYQKNIDGANNLALNLGSNIFSPITAELKISSQFDTGHYQLIRLTDAENNIIVEKISQPTLHKIPKWFSNLININPASGKAKVSNGWQQLGEIEVASSTQFAYHQLWRNSVLLLVYFLITGLISGLIGHYILIRVTEPLGLVVKQAEAIGDRRFITTEEPKTREFKALVSSMNKLSKRVQSMLSDTAEKLQSTHQGKNFDEKTQLLHRDALLDQIHAFLQRDDHTASGGIVLLRIPELLELNKLYGREKLDSFIDKIAQTLKVFVTENSDVCAGRLDGGEFSIIFPDKSNCKDDAETLITNIRNDIFSLQLPNNAFLACTSNYLPREDFEVIHSRLSMGIDELQTKYNTASDGNTEKTENFILHINHKDDLLPNDEDSWRDIFETAFLESNFQLNLFPVIGNNTSLLHLEAPIRLIINNEMLLNAGQFLGWAKRTNKITLIDITGLSLAFSWLEKQKSDIGINISPELLADKNAQTAFLENLSGNKHLAHRLWIEIPESGVYHHINEFKLFAAQLKILGCHVGIEHAGHSIEKIGLLHDVGLDYIKIDSAFIRAIENNHANQVFLQGLVTIAHAIGLKIIAEGVQKKSEVDCLWGLGFDGQTGPAIGISS